MQQSDESHLKSIIEEDQFYSKINLKPNCLAKTIQFKERSLMTNQKSIAQNTDTMNHGSIIPVKNRLFVHHSKGYLPLSKGPIVSNQSQPKNLKIENPVDKVTIKREEITEQKPSQDAISLAKVNTKLPGPFIRQNPKLTDPGFLLPTEDNYKKIAEFFNNIKGFIGDGTQSARGNIEITLIKSNTDDNKEYNINTRSKKAVPLIKKKLVIRKLGTKKVVKNEVKCLEKKGEIKMSQMIKQQPIKNSKGII